jgi:hypothetical protein
MYPEREAFMLDEEWPLVAEVIPTLRLALRALSVEES